MQFDAECSYQTGSAMLYCAFHPDAACPAGTVFWAARYSTWLLIKLTVKGVVFSFLFLQAL